MLRLITQGLNTYLHRTNDNTVWQAITLDQSNGDLYFFTKDRVNTISEVYRYEHKIYCLYICLTIWLFEVD